jgi:hypothetical protein
MTKNLEAQLAALKVKYRPFKIICSKKTENQKKENPVSKAIATG